MRLKRPPEARPERAHQMLSQLSHVSRRGLNNFAPQKTGRSLPDMLIYETPKMQVTTDTPKRPYRIPECNAPRYTSGILHCVLTCVRTPFRMTRGWGFHREVHLPGRSGRVV